MNIQVLGFAGCPNTPQTRRNVENAVAAVAAAIGIDADVIYVDQEQLPEDDRRRGWPTPTILVDGRDLFGMPAPRDSAMGCRMYKGAAPSESEIAAALALLARQKPKRGQEPFP